MQEIDLWPVVVQSGARLTPDDPHAEERLMKYAKAHCSPKIVAFLYKNSAFLKSIIKRAWRWEEVEDRLAVIGQTRMEAFAAALKSLCVCGGKWLTYVNTSLRSNGINVPELCHYVLRNLEVGRHESVKVVVLVGRYGGEGKSLFLEPLAEIYGNGYVQPCPQEGRFPLVGLDGKKICLLNEWQFLPDVVPMSVQLLWYEGKPVPVTLPQNGRDEIGHMLYEGTAPIFCTTPEEGLTDIMAAGAHAPQGQNSMLIRRLKLFHFTKKMPPPTEALKACPKCFAFLVSSKASEWRCPPCASRSRSSLDNPDPDEEMLLEDD